MIAAADSDAPSFLDEATQVWAISLVVFCLLTVLATALAWYTVRWLNQNEATKQARPKPTDDLGPG